MAAASAAWRGVIKRGVAAASVWRWHHGGGILSAEISAACLVAYQWRGAAVASGVAYHNGVKKNEKVTKSGRTSPCVACR